MKKSVLKKIIKSIIKEVSQKDIRSRHPQPAMPTKWNDQRKPDFSKMTLDNIKAIKDKCKRQIEYIKSRPELKDDLQKEFKLWKLCDDEIKRRLQYINKPVNENKGMGYNHNSTSDIRNIPSVRDELNDPILNGKLHEDGEKTEHFSVEWGSPDITENAGKIYLGDKWFANAIKLGEDYGPKFGNKWVINRHSEALKLKLPSTEIGFDNIQSLLNYLEKWYQSRGLNEQYRFDDFTYLARGDGFDVPSDVYYGTIYLGTIVSRENGYLIGNISGPRGENRSYKQDSKKPFKTKDDAAEALHRAWKSLRHGGETKSF